MRETKARNLLLLIICCLLFFPVLSFSSCNGSTEPPTNGGTPSNGEKPEIKNPNAFIIADISDIATLDPALGYDTASAGQIQNIYETLVNFDSDSTNAFVPSLATEWSISPNGKTYRFLIREGVVFHNGNPLTPEDVEYSFERGMVQDYGLGPQWMLFEPFFGLGIYTSRTDEGLIALEEITSKVEVDGQWVQINLAIPYEPFLQIIASSWGSIVDMDWCIENGDWNGTQESYEALNNPDYGISPIQRIANGTGPFMLEHWQPAVEISLIRNNNYWGEPAYFERVITKIVEEWSLRRLMLEQGDVDCIVVPSGQIQEVKGIEGVLAYEGAPTLLNQAFFFQFEIDPISTLIGSGQLDGKGIPTDFFSDVDVRKGFAFAFDWETYIDEAMMGYGQQIASPIVENLPYYSADWSVYEKDLSKAESYLREAWNGELWENGFELTLLYVSGDMTGKIACEILQNNLFEINPSFKINIQLMNWPTLLSEMVLGRLPMYVNGWTADYPDPHNFVFPYMHSEGTFAKWQRYINQEVDSLIEQAVASSNALERQELYNQIAEIYYEDVPSIMISQVLGVFFFRDWIQGFVYNPIKPTYVMYAYSLEKG